MKQALISTLLILFAILASAGENPNFINAFEFDGLPLRIEESSRFRLEEMDEFGTIDLGPYFETLGVEISPEGFIRYNSGSGNIVCKGSEQMIELVETIVTSLSYHEKEIEYARAYLAILKPLSDDERVSAVLKVGYRPDKIISSYITRILEMQTPIDRADFFSGVPKFPGEEDPFELPNSQEIDARTKKVIEMKKVLSKLLRNSLEALETQLRLLSDPKPESNTAGD